MLHIVNKSNLERSALDACLRIATGGTLLLIEDGVYSALAGTPGEAKLREAMARFSVCALAPDLEARGVADRVMEGVALVDYGGFVDLVASHPTCQSWL